jgi:hypothetical protein
LSALIVVAGLYAIYLFYLGLPAVMHTPADKVVPYMVVCAIVDIVVMLIVGSVTATLMAL